jgi:hypothetical protein
MLDRPWDRKYGRFVKNIIHSAAILVKCVDIPQVRLMKLDPIQHTGHIFVLPGKKLANPTTSQSCASTARAKVDLMKPATVMR